MTFSQKPELGKIWQSSLIGKMVLDEENRRLKQMVADLSIDKHMLQDVLSRKL
jgi:putative transposase